MRSEHSEPALEIALEDPQSDQAAWCLREYFNELSSRFEFGFDPNQSISADPEELRAPAGYFLIARLNGEAIGCGALKVKDEQVGEIKRMWVASSSRGLGVGRRLLEALEGLACNIGLNVLRLETNKTLSEAHALYRAHGFVEVTPFSDEPYAHHWFEKVGLQDEARVDPAAVSAEHRRDPER